MPAKSCPSCPFNTLCNEERTCPLLGQSPVNIIDIKEELRQFAKLRSPERIPYVESSIKGRLLR